MKFIEVLSRPYRNLNEKRIMVNVTDNVENVYIVEDDRKGEELFGNTFGVYLETKDSTYLVKSFDSYEAAENYFDKLILDILD